MEHVNIMWSVKIMEEMDTTETNPVTAVKEDAVYKTTEIGAEAAVVEPPLFSQITVGHTECVPIRLNNVGPHNMDTKMTQYVATRY